MTRGLIPYSEMKQLSFELTTFFETSRKPPECYTISTGNFDGAGISFGAMQWQLMSGTLQPIWAATNRDDEAGCRAIFGADYDEWMSVQTKTTGLSGTAVAWGDSITDWTGDSTGHAIKAPWKGYFTALGGLQACIDAQVNATASYYATSEQWKIDFGLWSRRGYCLMYDIAIHAGGMLATTKTDILNQIAAIDTTGKTREQIETEKMNIIWQRRLEDISTTNAAYVPFRDRKSAIANGSGLVYGSMFYTEPYDAILEPAYESDVIITNGVYIGATPIDTFRLGGIAIDEIYKGAELVYQKPLPAPITTISPSATVQNTIPITVTLTADDPEATIYYKIGTGSQLTYTAPFTVNQNSAGVNSTNITIQYWSVANGVTEATKSITYNTSGAIPAKPTLTAVAGVGKVDLSWTSSQNATAFTIYRSTVAGTLGTWIGTTQYYGVSTLSYSDVSVTAGTTYYYTIRAGNYGTPTDSDQKSAIPTAAPVQPTGWRYLYIEGYGSVEEPATTRIIEFEAWEGSTNRMSAATIVSNEAVSSGGAVTAIKDGTKTASGYPLWWTTTPNARIVIDLGAIYPLTKLNYYSYSITNVQRTNRFKISARNNTTDAWTPIWDNSGGAAGAQPLLPLGYEKVL
jgi:hypothetical protein